MSTPERKEVPDSDGGEVEICDDGTNLWIRAMNVEGVQVQLRFEGEPRRRMYSAMVPQKAERNQTTDETFRSLIRLCFLRMIEPNLAVYLDMEKKTRELLVSSRSEESPFWLTEERDALLRVLGYSDLPSSLGEALQAILAWLGSNESHTVRYKYMKASGVKPGDEFYVGKNAPFTWVRIIQVERNLENRVGIICKGVMQLSGTFTPFDFATWKDPDEEVSIRRTT